MFVRETQKAEEPRFVIAGFGDRFTSPERLNRMQQKRVVHHDFQFAAFHLAQCPQSHYYIEEVIHSEA
jgi:hypothetical protein